MWRQAEGVGVREGSPGGVAQEVSDDLYGQFVRDDSYDSVGPVGEPSRQDGHLAAETKGGEHGRPRPAGSPRGATGPFRAQAPCAMPGPHDLFARYTFSRPERAEAELRAVLSVQVVFGR